MQRGLTFAALCAVSAFNAHAQTEPPNKTPAELAAEAPQVVPQTRPLPPPKPAVEPTIVQVSTSPEAAATPAASAVASAPAPVTAQSDIEPDLPSLVSAVSKPAPPLVSIDRQGYAFEFPRVLAQQRLFGLAHGVSLLAESCKQVPAQGGKQIAAKAGQAYAAWRTKQRASIDLAQHELAEFYFGTHAADAHWMHIARALNLREQLDFAADAPQLASACESLPQALAQPRYDLGALLHLEESTAQTIHAARVEAQVTACSKRLSGEAQAKLQTQFEHWREAQGLQPALARSHLLAEWHTAKLQGNPEEWLAALPQRFSQPPQATCDKLGAWLASPESAMSASFAAAPQVPVSPALPEHGEPVVVPVVVSAGGADKAATSVANSADAAPAAASGASDTTAAPTSVPTPAPVVVAPAATTTPPASAEPVITHPEYKPDQADAPAYPNLFELLMRLLDEPAKESPRAQSPRAHP